MILLLIYIAIFVAAFALVRLFRSRVARRDFTSLKTVTFGDEMEEEIMRRAEGAA